MSKSARAPFGHDLLGDCPSERMVVGHAENQSFFAFKYAHPRVASMIQMPVKHDMSQQDNGLGALSQRLRGRELMDGMATAWGAKRRNSDIFQSICCHSDDSDLGF